MGGTSTARRSATDRAGSRIRKAREAIGLSQMGLADRAGVNIRTLERIESGETEEPRPSTVTVLELALREAAAA